MPKITPEMLAKSGTEDGEQTALFCYANEIVKAGDYRWELLYAIPNGGKRGVATAARLAATGTKAGFPDVGLPIACAAWHGLFIELKRLGDLNRKPGKLADAQKLWRTRLQAQHFKVEVCYGWRAAADVIQAYLNEQWQ